MITSTAQLVVENYQLAPTPVLHPEETTAVG